MIFILLFIQSHWSGRGNFLVKLNKLREKGIENANDNVKDMHVEKGYKVENSKSYIGKIMLERKSCLQSALIKNMCACSVFMKYIFGSLTFYLDTPWQSD